LEQALHSAKYSIEEIQTAQGDKLAISVIREGTCKFVGAKDHSRAAIMKIQDVL